MVNSRWDGAEMDEKQVEIPREETEAEADERLEYVRQIQREEAGVDDDERQIQREEAGVDDEERLEYVRQIQREEAGVDDDDGE